MTSCLYLALALFSCQPQTKQKFDLLILNASIVDVEAGQVSKKKLIGIDGDTIRLVADMNEASAFEGSREINAGNRYVMPGLWDMHVHFRGGDSLRQENKNLLPLFLSYGVTTVRDAGGDLTPSVLSWKNEIQGGRLPGPDIFTSGPKLDGADPYWPGSIPVADSADIAMALDSLQKLHTDYVKTYDSSLKPDLYYGLIRGAEARDMKITGHMPLKADLMRAANYGLDGVEHLYYLLGVASPLTDSLQQLDLGYGIVPPLVRTFDRELAAKAFRKLGSQNFYVTPTLFIGKVLTALHGANHSTDSLLAVIGPGIRKTYERRTIAAQNRSHEAQLLAERQEKLFQAMVPLLQQSGINLLAGSDCGAYNSYVYPGASLQKELQMLVASGLSPREALYASVINGPKFFDLSDYYGSISPGKVANLLLLAKNPLENIGNTEQIDFVIKRGTVLEKDALRAMRQPTNNE